MRLTNLKNPVLVGLILIGATVYGILTAELTTAAGLVGNESMVRADSIWVGDHTGCNGDTVIVEIGLQNGDTPIDVFTLNLEYPESMLDYVGCTAGSLNPGWVMFGCNESAAGVITVAGFTFSASIPAGSAGTLAILTFTVNCASCVNGDASALTLAGLQDDLAAFTAVNGTFTYQCGATATPTTALTATATRTPTRTPTPAATASPTPTGNPVGDHISIGQYSGCNGDQITVSVILSNDITEVDAITIRLAFDASMLDYVSCSSGELNPGWVMFDCFESGVGELTIAGFSVGNEIPVGSNGSLADLIFTVDCPGCSIGDSSGILFTLLADDLVPFTSHDGGFTYVYGPTQIPTPTSTPASGDVLWIENAAGCNGSTIIIPVMMRNDNTPVDAITIDVDYDGAMLDFISCSVGALDPGWMMFNCNEATPNRITIAGFTVTGFLPPGSAGSIALLTFTINCPGCYEGQTSALEITRHLDDLTDFLPYPGTFTYQCGATATPTPVTTPNLLWVSDAAGCNGDSVVVPVMIDNPTIPIDAFTITIQYDTTVLAYQSCTAGSLDPSWIMFDCNEATPGLITGVAFAYPGVIPAGSYGSLLLLTFTVNCPACVNGDTSSLVITVHEDDIETFIPAAGTFTYLCGITPTPTPAPQNNIWMSNAYGCNGDEIIVPVMIDNPSASIDAFTFYLDFDTTMLQFTGCEAGELNPPWFMFDCNENPTGTVVSAGFTITGEIPAGSNGTLAILYFVVDCPGCAEGDLGLFEFTLLDDDLIGFNDTPGNFMFSCATTPTPGPIPATSTSGIIVLLAVFLLMLGSRTRRQG